MSKFRMTTAFGQQHGFEIQALRLADRAIFYRMTGRDWCSAASSAEVILWRYAGLAFGTDGETGMQKKRVEA